ncbi:hypothetical protein L2E82_51363 [Cichorium intybus]|nr:hypothetical protein L2E82_51363 [Cichorium intybus]
MTNPTRNSFYTKKKQIIHSNPVCSDKTLISLYHSTLSLNPQPSPISTNGVSIPPQRPDLKCSQVISRHHHWR